MKFVFFPLSENEKMDSVMKGLTEAIPQKFWARTAPAVPVTSVA